MPAANAAELDAIRAGLAQREIEQRARVREAAAKRKRRPGRTQSHRTRERLSRAVYLHKRAEALADPQCHPLRRRRLTFRGEGLTLKALAARALVSHDTIQKIEVRSTCPERLTLKRLAKALDCGVRDLVE